MSLPLNQAIEAVLKIFEFSEDDHNAFMSDVKTIATEIHQKVIGRNSIFKDMLKDLHKTAHYRKGSFFDMPDEFCSHLLLELPFDNVDFCFTDPHFVQFKTDHDFPIVYEGHIDAFVFAFSFHNTLNKVISDLPPILCSGKRIYLVSLVTDNFDGIRGWTQIIAKEQFYIDGHPGVIKFQFQPILKFPVNSKYRVAIENGYDAYWTSTSQFPEPITYRNRFRQFIPKFQVMKRDDMIKARKAIILVHSLVIYGRVSKISPVVENFMYKNIYFAVLQGKCIKYMRDTNLSTIFLDMLWKMKCRVLDYEFPGNNAVYVKLEDVCHTLMALKVVNVVPFKAVLNLFGIF